MVPETPMDLHRLQPCPKQGDKPVELSENDPSCQADSMRGLRKERSAVLTILSPKNCVRKLRMVARWKGEGVNGEERHALGGRQRARNAQFFAYMTLNFNFRDKKCFHHHDFRKSCRAGPPLPTSAKPGSPLRDKGLGVQTALARDFGAILASRINLMF